MTHKNTDWIETYKGHRFYPLEPDQDLIDIEDIAHALSNTCRFTGHCEEFYSVAQHSVLVSLLVSKKNRLAGLIHDAAEAYLCDIAKPIKPFIKGYKEIEQQLLNAIFEKFGLTSPCADEIKEIDYRLCFTEANVLGFNTDTWTNLENPNYPIIPVEMPIEPWGPAQAERQFLWAFHDLTYRTIKVA